MENFLAIGPGEERCIEDGAFTVDDVVDEDFISHFMVAVGDDLSPADEFGSVAGHRFEDIAVALDGEACGGGVEFQRLHGGLGHQRARHARVFVEMPFIEPSVCRHMGAGLEIAASPWSA